MQSPTTKDINIIKPTQARISARYTRVSTDRQEKEATIETQVAELTQRIESDGCVLSPENDFMDNGWSGAVDRPGLDSMLAAARAGRFNTLYIFDYSRLARLYHHQRLIMEELEKCGVAIVSLHNRPIESPEDHLFQGFEGLFDEYERFKILLRTRGGRERKAKEKVLMSGQARYGYDRIAKTKDKPAHWIINKEEAKVVRMIFDWIGRKNMSVNAVRQKLYDLSILTKKGKHWWSKGHIRRIITSEIYLTGSHYYNTTRAVPPTKPLNKGYRKLKNTSKEARPRDEWILEQKVPIVLNRAGDKQLFKKVQKIMADNKKYARQKRKHEYLLSGNVFCECGKPRSGDGSSRHGHHYYRCTERIYVAPNKRECVAMGVNADAVDKKVWSKLTKFLADPKALKVQAQKWLEAQAQTKGVQEIKREQLLNKIKQIEEEEERYQDLYGKKMMKFNQLKKKIRECNNSIASLRKQIKELDTESEAAEKITPDQLHDFCQQVNTTLKKLDYRNKRVVIRELVDKVIVYGQQNIELWGHIPLTTERLGYGLENRPDRLTQRWQVNII